MTSFALGSNIQIDALHGPGRAQAELGGVDDRWIVGIEAMSRVEQHAMVGTLAFLDRFQIDELDATVSSRAAALRRERGRLKAADAVILASAQVNWRTLVTCNTKDFPASLPGIRIPYTI